MAEQISMIKDSQNGNAPPPGPPSMPFQPIGRAIACHIKKSELIIMREAITLSAFIIKLLVVSLIKSPCVRSYPRTDFG